MKRIKFIRISGLMAGILVVRPYKGFLQSLHSQTAKDNLSSTSKKYFINNQTDFDKYKSFTFEEGSIILFAKGKIFEGQFSPKGSGTAGNPIVVTAYDPSSGKIGKDGAGDKAVINGMGKVLSCFYLFNAEYWTITNLEITNDSSEALSEKKNLRGIDIQATDKGILHNIIIRNNYIHDVNNGLAGKERGGIFLDIKGNTIPTKFDHLRIENNIIKNVGGIGICNSSSWGKPGTENYFPTTDFKIIGNYIENTGRNAIILRNSISPIIEYNTVANSSRYDTGNSIFNFNTIGCMMQYNEVYGNTGALSEADRGAFDADYNSTGTIIQYNYSHDNHWCTSIMRKRNSDITIRYNISQNNLMGAYFYGFPEANEISGVKIYNNTHYFGPGKGTEVFPGAGKKRTPSETALFNNIFYFTDPGKWGNVPDESCKTENNLFYNFGDNTKNELVGDPMLVNPGSGKTNIDMHHSKNLSGYELKRNSPAINGGKPVKDNGGKDFFGNKLYHLSPDIGAHEFQG